MSDALISNESPLTPNTEPGTPLVAEDHDVTSSLENLQSDEQRRILDMVAQLRKCGIENELSLPQLVVCGDQSAGKSSVLEALTRIPFPRNDNLCTRFATEISLRRAATDTLTIKVLPDDSRSSVEKLKIKSFVESITNFDDLPRIMGLAMAVMGITSDEGSNATPRAFARDILSIEIGGPSQPQLTVVDIPGLIATSTKGVTTADVEMVAEITDFYIAQPRTICLAVITATNDFANQRILQKVRDVDPEGDRTLGIITKPDGVPANSGSEQAFINLAKNEEIFFKLGWHVLKNRRFEESHFTIDQRNISEAAFFRTSNFKVLPPNHVGIDALRHRLSVLLFEHVKKELPQLHEELEEALENARNDLHRMGKPRSTPLDCKAYLAQLSLDFYETCKSAVNGHYESDYFQKNNDADSSNQSGPPICRTRALIQSLNGQFAETVRLDGHKYQINISKVDKNMVFAEDEFKCEPGNTETSKSIDPLTNMGRFLKPKTLTKIQALDWVRKVLLRTRGKELPGNFNPLLIGELFWEQSSRWERLAINHVQSVSTFCSRFLKQLLQDKCPKDVADRIWISKVEDELKTRNKAAFEELGKLLEDLKSYPLNYNHYYTDTIKKRRQEREKDELAKSIEAATNTETTYSKHGGTETITKVDLAQVLASYSRKIDPNMDNFSCEEALDCLFAIYKVSSSKSTYSCM
jgi:GTPase SAR1 family protein